MNTVLRRSRELSFIQAPGELPENIHLPKYEIGDRCRWVPMTSSDWGTVIGQVLAPVQTAQPNSSQWSWLYLILLDADSPSRPWVTTEWAEEDDIERLQPSGVSQSAALNPLENAE
ncbi:hypothetical protein [Phormidesmis priestleyi]|uniref:hypothetical protein n=1 Tax=Phormidesmis priestleyi TaxID=268141 RepID=UPI0012E7E1D0|nr:hypothetical protein [Phormidesmis priestleyi]